MFRNGHRSDKIKEPDHVVKDLISIGGSFVVQNWFILGMKMLRSNGVKIS